MKKSHLHGAFCATVFLVISLSSQVALVGVLPATSSGTDWQAVYDNHGDIRLDREYESGGQQYLWSYRH